MPVVKLLRDFLAHCILMLSNGLSPVTLGMGGHDYELTSEKKTSFRHQIAEEFIIFKNKKTAD